MGYSEHFQTIIYNHKSGIIRAVFPNQYIKSVKALCALLGVGKTRDFRFLYYRSLHPIDPAMFKIKTISNTRPASLVTRDGADPTLYFFRADTQWTLEHYTAVTFVFEGGLGDYLDQADTLIALGQKYPDAKLTAVLSQDRLAALRMLGGFDAIKYKAPKDDSKTNSVPLLFSKINLLGGNYPKGGKVGVYSAIAGLPGPAQRADVLLSPDRLANARANIAIATCDGHSHLFALHTMSGNTNTKSLSPARALDLIEPLLKIKNLFFLHFGGAGEATIDHPQVISLQGKLSWDEVFYSIACCDGCVCIDSAIMHIAQHLNIPTVSFWGPTLPQVILDTPPGVATIITNADCRGCNRYDCDDDFCMIGFDKAEISRKFKKLLVKKDA